MSIGLILFHAENLSETDRLKPIFINRAASEYTGTDLDQLIGEYIFDAFPDLAKTDIPRLVLEVARTKKSQNLGAMEYGDNHVRKGYYAVKAFPMPKDCVGLTLEDITLRKKTDEMIKDYTKELQKKK